MFKNTILIILLIFTTSCGYEPLHSKKNRIDRSNISITKINFIGDRDINIKIKEQLASYSKVKKEKDYTLEVNSEILKTTIAKDAKGDPSVFSLSIKTIVQVKREDNINEKVIFSENFKYNNNEDKFEIRRYEKEIKRNLAQIIANDLIFKLSNY